MDQLIADIVPDDPGHLIAIEFNDRVCDLNFCHDPILFDPCASDPLNGDLNR
jgi:hypothetical protein